MNTLFDDDKFDLDDDDLWWARMGGPDADRMRLRELLAAHPEYDGGVTGPLNNAQVREHVAELRGIDRRAKYAPESARSNVQPEVVVAPLPAKKGEPPKEKEEEKFKVVEATPVEVTAGTSEWRQFINLKADKSALQNGRSLEVTAKLDKKQAGIEVFFGIEPGTKNCAEDKLGAGLTAKISASGRTDAEGVAKATLNLSAFGGDTFKVLASLTRNPKPDGDVVKSKPVAVWRKLWYQMAVPEGFSPPVPGKSEAAWKSVFVDFEKCDTISVKKSDCPDRTFYPEWMLMVGGSEKDAAVVGSHNKKDFFNKFTADASKPLRANLVICEHQWDWEGVTEPINEIFKSKSPLVIEVKENVKIIKPSLRGPLVVFGEWKTQDGKKKGKITDTDIDIPRDRGLLSVFRLQFPANAPDPTDDNPILVKLELGYAEDYLGESSGNNILAVYNPYDIDDYNNTITHEVGHSVNQTPRKGPRQLGDHPHFYDDVNGGQGPHCSTVAGNKKGTLVTLVKTAGKPPPKTRDGRVIEKVYKEGICVMFHAGDPTCIGKFCETCEPYVRMQDMSKWK